MRNITHFERPNEATKRRVVSDKGLELIKRPDSTFGASLGPFIFARLAIPPSVTAMLLKMMRIFRQVLMRQREKSFCAKIPRLQSVPSCASSMCHSQTANLMRWCPSPTILAVVRFSVQHCAVKSTARNMPKCRSNSCAGSGPVAVSSKGWFGDERLKLNYTPFKLKPSRVCVSASSNQAMCGQAVYKTQSHGYDG